MKRVLLLILAGIMWVVAGNTTSRERVLETTRNLFCRQWNLNAGQVVVHIRKWPPELNRVHYDDLSVTSQKRVLKPGVQTVWLELYWQDQQVRKWPMVVDVTVKRRVAVAARTIRRGETIGEQDIRWVERETGRDWRQYIAQGFNWQNMESRQTIGEGKAITRALIRPIPLIHSGERVKVEVGAGRLSVETDGMAMEDGTAGKRIKVRLSTGKIVRARVVQAGKLLLQ
ncbi:MAG: flagella basal body P-ring formation protein FlgA [Calditrichaeota bacterium]|nr:MAG: flagella basal body P-ring formation protein FlgA [Calditrichota bacterium]